MNQNAIIAVPLTLLFQATSAAEGEATVRLAESPLSAGNLATTAMGLLIVLGVMLGLAWIVRRFLQAPGMGKGAIRVLGGVSLGARERAVLLSVDRRRILVGIAPGQVRTLADLGIDESMEASDADQADPASSFARQLGQLVGQRPDVQKVEGK
jgi:flagellar protein FliO/FliZ